MKTIAAICLALFAVANSAGAAAPKKPASNKKKDTRPEKVDPAAFLAKFDEDSDKKLDKAELSKGLKSLRNNSVTTRNDSWKRFDADGDGKIDLNELKKLLEENK